MKKRLCTVLANLAAWIASLIVLVPMLVVLVNSFKSQKESMVMTLTLPEKFMFENYTTVIERGNCFHPSLTAPCMQPSAYC